MVEGESLQRSRKSILTFFPHLCGVKQNASWTDRKTNGQTNEPMVGWTDRWTNRRTVGPTNGRTDGLMDIPPYRDDLVNLKMHLGTMD